MKRPKRTAPTTLAAPVPKGKPARITVTTVPSSPISSWTYERILSALDAHERGDFSRSAHLADAFGRDDRITACMTTRVQAITGRHGADFSIEPSERGSKTRAKMLARDVEAWWYDAVPERTLKQIQRVVTFIGVSISRIEWTPKDGKWIPDITPWPMESAYWDETKLCWILSAQEGQIEVRKGDPNWLIVAASNDRPWMDGMVRCLALPFLLRTFSARDWARFCERHGLPIIAIEEPSDAGDEDKKTFADSMRRMGREGVLRLPQQTDMNGGKGNGFKVDFIEPKDTAWQSFEAFRKDLSASIAIAILGQNLTTEVQGGSLAASKTHNQVRLEYRDSDVELLTTELHDGLIVPYVAFHSPNDIDAAPWPHWNTNEAEDKNEIVKVATQTAGAIEAFKNAGLRVDLVKFIESVGIPMLPGLPVEEPEEPEEEPPTPPAKPDDEGDDEESEDDELSVLASGDIAPGFTDGQRYADDLAENAAKASADAMGPSLDALLALINGADSFDAVRAGLAETYASMDPSDMEDLTERAEIMARLAGKHAVLVDL